MPCFPDEAQLIQAAVAGDEGAMSAVIAALMPCVEANASLAACNGITRCDLIQEGLMGAVNAVFSFDSSKGIRFSSYAEKCISNSIVTAVRKYNRKKQKPLNTYVPIESVEHSLYSNVHNPEAVVSMEENVSLITSSINSVLTPLERDVLLLHIADNSYESISRKLGISKKSVGNALNRARRKIKSELEKNI